MSKTSDALGAVRRSDMARLVGLTPTELDKLKDDLRLPHVGKFAKTYFVTADCIKALEEAYRATDQPDPLLEKAVKFLKTHHDSTNVESHKTNSTHSVQAHTSNVDMVETWYKRLEMVHGDVEATKMFIREMIKK